MRCVLSSPLSYLTLQVKFTQANYEEKLNLIVNEFPKLDVSGALGLFVCLAH